MGYRTKNIKKLVSYLKNASWDSKCYIKYDRENDIILDYYITGCYMRSEIVNGYYYIVLRPYYSDDKYWTMDTLETEILEAANALDDYYEEMKTWDIC